MWVGRGGGVVWQWMTGGVQESRNDVTPDSGGTSRKTCPITLQSRLHTSRDRTVTHIFIERLLKYALGLLSGYINLNVVFAQQKALEIHLRESVRSARDIKFTAKLILPNCMSVIHS